MDRSCLAQVGAPLVFALAVILSGCSSGSSTKIVSFPVPANVVLTPATTASVDVGATVTFTAQAEDNKNNAATQPVSYFSSNPAVATVAANGIACAGTWDSITSPQVCTPGPAGVAQITASAQGVSSPPTTLYVHQHIDSISVSPVPSQVSPTVPCITKGQTFEYAAKAFSRGSDITSTVGQFGWMTVNTTVVTLSTTATGLFQNQLQATAGIPGVSSTFASVGAVNSTPFDFVTCPVQSIVLSANGNSSNPITLVQGSSQTITATVKDSLGNVITGVPLTWTSSEPALVTAAAATLSATSTTGTASAAAPGGASVIASCTPPACNIGFQPSLPIYPQSAIGIVVTPTAGTTAIAGTLYVTSSGCQSTTGCTTTLVPVSIPGNTLGTAVNLTATPDSLVFSREGGSAYLGTDLGELGTKGLMKLAASATSSVTQAAPIAGKVVSISPDGTRLVISDIADPNSAPQVFVYDTDAGSATAVQLAAGTTSVAADFSPDSLKAFIVASNGSTGTLYVYSKIDALQTIPLSSGTKDVAFLPSGNFGYITDAGVPQLSLVPTCNNPPSSTLPQVGNTPTTAAPFIIRPVVDGRMLTVEPPGIELFTPTITGSGCAFPRPYPVTPDLNPGNLIIPGNLAVSNTAQFYNLGQGNFIPRQLIVSADGSIAYILANDSSNNSLAAIFVFNIPNHTSSAISLVGNAIPLQASLTPDGTVLYVGASDGTVHAVSTVAGGDFQQIAFPLGLCQNSTGAPFGTTCNPDLIAVAP
jgi:hypothetical protein